MRYFLSFFIGVYLSFILSPILMGFSWAYEYDYSLFAEKINIWTQRERIKHCFSSPRTTVMIGLPTSIDPARVEVVWHDSSEDFHRHIDQEDGVSPYGYTTFPLIYEKPIDCIEFSLEWTGRENIEWYILSFDLSPKKSYPTITPQVWASSQWIRIISRSEWWAPEEYRYISALSLKKEQDEWNARGKTPKQVIETSLEKSRREQADREIVSIRSVDPDVSLLQTVNYSEWWKKLIYPTRTTKKVDKIVLHHTAEDMNKTLDDATLVRNIYAYHANVRWWGDIGYHYLVWQRWAIYEGRAWWDYVEGFHAHGNNLWSVGVSVIGNYSDNTINRDQKRGIIEIVTHLATKYGIDPSLRTTWARPCGSWESCIWKKVDVPTILGHRDLSITACPGNHLYELLPEIRESVVWKVWIIKPIYNQKNKYIESRPPEDTYVYVLESTISLISQTPSQSIPSSAGSKNRVKVSLSYTGSSVDISGFSSRQPIVKNGVKRLQFLKKDTLQVQALRNDLLSIRIGMKSYTWRLITIESDVLRVDSWTRIPTWDTTKKYNDNLFRWRLLVRNDNGKLLIVNDLPVEDYLRGMGEVSESDARSDPEKVKAIIVAARSYALYYADPKLPYKDRKFPGKPYDISDNPDESQQYKGYSYELRSPTVSTLVWVTKWEVITYNNKTIKAPYSQSPWRERTYSYTEYCVDRGVTTCKDIPYLQSVVDPGAVWTSRSGHGFGISWVGATYFSRIWWDYKKIIKYYLTGVEIQKK